MPLDTREKRASAINWFTPLPLPDGTVSEDDRTQVSWVYVGTEAQPVTTRRIRTSSSEPRGLSTSSRHGTGSTSSTEPRGLATSSTTEGA